MYSGPDDIPALMQHLTARDRFIIDLLGRHQVLTIDQIHRIAFGSRRSARRRVAELCDFDALTRFRGRVSPGSQAYRYTLGYTGTILHAAATGQRLPTRPAWRERLARIAASPVLGHRLGVNDFFCRILACTRDRADLMLTEWLSETETADLTGGMIRPDAAATLRNGEREHRFWFEHDADTETLARLAAKADRYAELLAGHDRTVLFELTGPVREANLLAALTERRWPMPIAITVTDRATDPTGPVWRLVGRPGLWRLIDLEQVL
jgi:hypothetical protein